MPDLEPDVRQMINYLIDLMEHPGFKFLQRRLDAEKHNAMIALSKVNPNNVIEIMQLQEIVARADYFPDTLKELIEEGATQEDLTESEDLIGEDGESTEFPDTGY